MLFVFQVDTGRMMTFDMSLALESVESLKQHVEQGFKIPADQQVLLISGGEHLRLDDRVCSYPAGTDTNPIFLFSKAVLESNVPPAASVDHVPDHDFTTKVRESSDLPPTYSSVQRRAQLARLFVEVGQNQLRICEKLVHEQHLMQQGWAASLANLEDVSSDLKGRWGFCAVAFKEEFIAKRDSYLEFLTRCKDNLSILQKIPVLPALIEAQKSIVPEQPDFSGDEQTESMKNEMTLLEWISQRDDFFESLFETCSKGIIQTDEREFLVLQQEVEHKLALTDNVHMKEIKGIGDRLCGLETLMQTARRIVNDQLKIAESFQRHQTRATQIKEPSILPDLCATHQQQLNCLLDHHSQLRDIVRRCTLAKNELSANLYQRLRWIVYTEDQLCELDNKLVFHYENLLSLQRQLEILQQVHTAPEMYLSTIMEVVRRRKFSQAYMLWSSDVACHLCAIYNEEIARRKEFQAQIEGHFLSSLFPGMDDLPPPFAIQAPSVFDSNLPKLTDDDVDRLKRELPEMSTSLNFPDMSFLNYFTSKEPKDEGDKNVQKTVEDKLLEVVAEVGLASNLDQNILKAIENQPPSTTTHGLPHLKDLDRGCESETDTEEFEKVGQSPFDLHFDKGIPSPRPGTQDASTLTEDNLQISRSEHEKLKSVLVKLAQVGRQVYSQLRSELAETKNTLLQEKASVEEACENLKTNITNILTEREQREREIIQRLTVEHELEISDFKKVARLKEEEVGVLRDENIRLKDECDKISQDNREFKQELEDTNERHFKDIEEMKKKIEEKLLEKEKCVKEVTEKLKSEYKSELENIRVRFKLMTMERSPSENSLEKIERGDYSSITSNHEALLLQMTENFETEKELAVSDAISKEAQKWQKILDDRIKDMQCDFEQTKAFLIQDVQSRIRQDQEKQINQMREQINNLNLECIKYKDTIQQLAECNEESGSSELVRRIEFLEKEKTDLKEQLDKFKAEPTGMAASVAVCEGAATTDAATSPVKVRKRSEISTPRVGKITVDSCKPGDLVLVVWDVAHQNFKILQESTSLYFLNADCLESLGLKVVDGQPNKMYSYGEVVEKEYCHARKPVNRFRVPQGTKFFRVKVKPSPSSTKEVPPTPQHQPPSALQSCHMSQSQTTSSQVSDVVTTAGPSHSLPSSPSKSNWEKSESQEAVIPEEKGEDTTSGGEVKIDEDVEKGTELTENFNVDNQSSIDR